MAEIFHQSGINMRYLGMVGDKIKDQNMTQMKYMVEREVVVRCMKHIMNKYIRECESEELLGATVSHILNCLLAPKEFIKRLDEKQMKYSYTNLNQEAEMNLLENLEKLNGPGSAAEAAEKEV
jgi:hypothetical protein